MRNFRVVVPFLSILVLTFSIACSEESPPAGEPSAAPALAPASVVPGSHEDWCEEHDVPESMCTRCNPSLIPAFQATGDWCEEHGLPESQCRACNPNLRIERPTPEEA